MKKSAIIFGAGKTGRGFAGHLAYLGGYELVLVDKDTELVKALKDEKSFDIQVLGSEELNCTVKTKAVYHIEDSSWYMEMAKADLLFCSVFGNNLEELSEYLSKGFTTRFQTHPNISVNFITCENYTNAASFLKQKISEKVNDSVKDWINEKVGFSESIILRTCLNASENQNPLTIRAQNFFDLPCDGEAFKGEIPPVFGLKPMKNFGHQLMRKIYTYNCINAVITYLGAQKGYTQLYQGGTDPEIVAVAKQAALESSEAQIKEFGFDEKEQHQWVESAFAKFADTNLPDPISRNGADPIRKLSANDRLIGPALLAIKHGIKPNGLIKGIIAGFDFFDEKQHVKVSNIIDSKGLHKVLVEVCGLDDEEKLYNLIKDEYHLQLENDK